MKDNLILIVVNEDELRFNLEDQLRTYNFPVLSAGNGKQALNILMTFPLLPSFIIVDHEISFREQLSTFKMFSSIPVIVLSDHVQKPLQIEKLLSLLRA